MSTITTRAGKGSPLTNIEVDANFTNLNTDKIQGNAFNQFTKPQQPATSVETAPTAGVISWDVYVDQIFRINLNASITTFNHNASWTVLVGTQYEVVVRYNGGTSIAWPADFKWSGGVAPTLTGTSGKVDIFTFVVSTTNGSTSYLLNTGIKQNVG